AARTCGSTREVTRSQPGAETLAACLLPRRGERGARSHGVVVLDAGELAGGEALGLVLGVAGAVSQPLTGDDGILVLAEDVLKLGDRANERTRRLPERRLDGLGGVAHALGVDAHFVQRRVRRI